MACCAASANPSLSPRPTLRPAPCRSASTSRSLPSTVSSTPAAILRSQLLREIDQTSEAFRFSAAVAGFGQLLRGGKYTESFGYTEVLRLARGARGMDRRGDAAEFIQLVQLADSLSAQQASVSTGD